MSSLLTDSDFLSSTSKRRAYSDLQLAVIVAVIAVEVVQMAIH